MIEETIAEFQSAVKDKELGWLFGNCFPNTPDTTVTYNNKGLKPDTYVITGDIDAMWLRDSTAQVWPYLQTCLGSFYGKFIKPNPFTFLNRLIHNNRLLIATVIFMCQKSYVDITECTF